MLVQCPNCKTTYKVSDDVVKGATPAFRCSRCRHTFEIEAQSTSAAVEPPKNQNEPATAANQELSFSFPEPHTASPAAGEADTTTPEPVPENKNVAPNDAQCQEQLTIDEARAKVETPFTIPGRGPTPEPESSRDGQDSLLATETFFATGAKDEDEESPGQIFPMSSYVEQRASIFPYLTLFALLAIAFSLIAAISRAQPKFSESMVKQIPLLGGALLRNNHLKNGILIRSLGTGYQSIQGNREVFVVTGVALNQNPVVIREVQITGKVYNVEGKELEQQTIWLGNTISPKIIRGMTGEDIPHLQNLKPLRSFEIPPGDSVSFTIVFLKAAKGAKDFTCQVVSAVAEV
jgi:predicted Zn finger-like uncharacterized protein